ncbi:MAG TPA: hypothetical protein VF461_15985, partial [Gemmatimonadaceae bacterium]
MTFLLRMATHSVVVFALALGASRESRAQLADSARIALGTRVWVRTRGGELGEWRFERTTPDNMTLRRRSTGSDELLLVPWSEAERVDTMVIASPSARRILVGGAAGALVGALVVYLGATLSPCNWDGGDCPALGFIILSPAIVGTGVAIGGAAGYFHRDWHWATAWRAPAP